MSINPKDFRNTVGLFATGITVITTVDENGKAIGLTANSFTSVSLNPPIILVCIDRAVTSFSAFQTAGEFAVNILGSEQTELSNKFATSGDEKWLGVEFETWTGRAPILLNCLANIECQTREIHESGDHIIITGEVKSLASKDGNPLLYWRGQYAQLKST
ncbi:MAG: flavin reductase [Rhodospirillaceae bacterium]|mgnify:CR=1 FL=1|nr:flavin reductase [Rhodospirillaceae bacterium]|tara:strand:+ start:6594 stop:7073 length:480 start_codon:yes stop_codon:yes gene_type:complete